MLLPLDRFGNCGFDSILDDTLRVSPLYLLRSHVHLDMWRQRMRHPVHQPFTRSFLAQSTLGDESHMALSTLSA